MRNFRDAETMAQTLRESLTAKAVAISHSESLELVSKMFGVADWNTLSALLLAERRETGRPAVTRTGASSYPAIPIRDLVPFPTVTFPLFVGREKTIQALNYAFERHREVALVVQRESSVDEPGYDDVYEVGVLARLIELERLDDSTLKVLVQAHRRVMIQGFVGETGAFQAEIADINEGPIPDAPILIHRAVARFKAYAAAREIRLPQISPPLERTRDPGRVADIISSHLAVPISERQALLATLDPVTRLERVDALMNAAVTAIPAEAAVAPRNAFTPASSTAGGDPVLSFSAAFSAALDLALADANQRKHEYATLEHLLLALAEDADASAVMKASNADLGALRANLIGYLDNEGKRLVIETGEDCKPTAAFQRAVQRAEFHAKDLGAASVTGAYLLLGIFPETRSFAVGLLGRLGVFRQDAANFVARGAGKAGEEGVDASKVKK